MDITNIKFEQVKLSHVKELKSLYKLIFGKKVSETYFIKKYGLQNKQHPKFALVAILNGSVVGFFGAIASNFTNQSSSIKTIQVCDYYFVKEIRGKGLLTKMYERIERVGIEIGLDLIYSFHSDQTYKASRKWGFSDVDNFRRVHFRCRPKFISKLFSKLGFLNWQHRVIEQHTCPIAEFQHVKELDVFEQDYSSDFFKLKKFCPHYLLKVGNTMAIVKYDHLLSVGYLNIANKSEFDVLLKKLMAIAKKAWVHEIVFQLRPHSQELEILEEYSPSLDSFKITVKNFGSEPLFDKVKLNYIDADFF